MKNTHEHPWAMSTCEFTWTPLSFINDAADKLGFGQLFSHVWFITVCCCFCICWFHFSSCFCFFILCWLGAPKNYPLPLLQNMFFFLFGYVWKWGDLFSLQRNHFGVKKGHFMLRHTHLLILFWTCVFVASMLCWFAPSKTDWNLQIHFSTKGFTLAQKITSDPHISKESDIHHSQNNEETFGKTICQKTCNSKKNQRKQIWKKTVSLVSLAKEKQSLKHDSF